MKEHRVLDVQEAELLRALHVLRYLTTEQIGRTWYPTRNLDACAKRLARLSSSQLLSRATLPSEARTAAWSIATGGLRYLRASTDHQARLERSLSPMFIPHHVATNEVFLILAAGETNLDRLAFEWVPSHRAGCTYEAMRRDEFGVLRRRGALLRADAIINPKTPLAPRIFLELDQSTECIREADGRRSIKRKITAYKQLLTTEWYAKTFPDRRPARVLFVLSHEDARAHDPAARDRRRRSILDAAKELGLGLDIQCVYLTDPAVIRKACGFDSLASPPTKEAVAPPTLDLSPDDLKRFVSLHRAVNEVFLTLPRDIQNKLIAPANDVRAVLLRLTREVRT